MQQLLRKANIVVDPEDMVFHNARDGCCCNNNARPIDGLIYVSPCCHVHWCVPKPLREEIAPRSKVNWRKREKRRGEQAPRMHVRKCAF